MRMYSKLTRGQVEHDRLFAAGIEPPGHCEQLPLPGLDIESYTLVKSKRSLTELQLRHELDPKKE
jgi:hypothetical protein